MTTEKLKNKIDVLWDVLASAGQVKPLDVVEQITCPGMVQCIDFKRRGLSR